jgi:hypothetical protein
MHLCSEQYDGDFSQVQGLVWFPWIGVDYSKRSFFQRMLVVGESHYFGAGSEHRYDELLKAHLEERLHTRHTLVRYTVVPTETIKTYENIPRLLFGQSKFDRGRFWADTAYHNFVQFPMRWRERPSPDQFVKGWEVFCQLVALLKPSHCLFIGVTASHSFNHAMNAMKITHVPVQISGKVGATYGRSASMEVAGHKTEMTFVKHLGSRFSPSAWNQHLRRTHPELMDLVDAGQYAKSRA